MKDFFLEMIEIDDFEVRKNAYYNLPYFYTCELRKDIDFKPILQTIEDEELEVVAASLKHFLKAAEENDCEDETEILLKMLDDFMNSCEDVIIKSIVKQFEDLLSYYLNSVNKREAEQQVKSPTSASADTFSLALPVSKQGKGRKGSDLVPSDLSQESVDTRQ